MSKILTAALLLAACCAAVFIVLFRLRAPRPEGRSAPVRAFIGAVALFTLFLGGEAYAADAHRPVALQDDGAAKADRNAARAAFIETLREVWKTLSPKDSGLFSDKAWDGAREGVVRGKVARLLSVAFREISYHVDRTENNEVMCYRMSSSGAKLMETRQTAVEQLRFLAKAVAQGKIDETTATKALGTLANSLEILDDSDSFHKNPGAIEKAKTLPPSDSALVASAIAVELESGKDPGLTPEQRLDRMKSALHDMISNGIPGWADWIKPGINPGLASIMREAGMLRTVPMVTCYSPTPTAPPKPAAEKEPPPPSRPGERPACYAPQPPPTVAHNTVDARGADLAALRKKILDRSVDAGVISAEVARRVNDADIAVEPAVGEFQREIRRVVRLMYEHGEFPPSYIEWMEKTLDAEIVEFSEEGALKDEIEFALRIALTDPNGPSVLRALEDKVLIKPARNRMTVGGRFGADTGPADGVAILNFRSLLGSGVDPAIPGDEGSSIAASSVNGPAAAWKIEMRRALRAAIKTGVTKPELLSGVERLLGVPLTGTLK